MYLYVGNWPENQRTVSLVLNSLTPRFLCQSDQCRSAACRVCHHKGLGLFTMLCACRAPHRQTGSHYFLVVICPKWEIVWYIDSLRPLGDDGITLGQRDFTSIKAVIDRYISELPHLQSSHLEHVTYLICS